MNYRKLAIVFSVLLLLIAIPIGLAIYRSTVDGEKVDATAVEAKQHVIYSVKNEEGQVDYVAVLNREFFGKVPIEKNFLVTVLETESASPFFGIERDTIKGFEKLFDFRQPPPFPLETWEFERIVATKFPELQFTKNDIQFLIQRGALYPQWREPEKAAILDAVLQIQSPALDEILAQLDQRPLFAVPQLDNREMLDNAIGNVEGQMHNIARWLHVRAGKGLLDNDLEAVWSDTRALLQLADRAAQGPTFTGIDLSRTITRMALSHLQVLLTDPELKPELLKQIHSELDELIPVRNFVRQVDIGERACGHELMNQELIKNKFTDTQEYQVGRVEDVDRLMPGWVRTNAAIDQFNRYVDEVVELLRDPPEDPLQAVALLKQKRIAELEFSDSVVPSVSADEQKKAVRGMLLMDTESLSCWLDWVVECYVANLSINRTLRLAVAIRLYQLDHQQFPESLDQLSGQLSEACFVDPYTGRPWDYQCQGTTAKLFCSGANGKDERERTRDYAWGDDIYFEFSIEPVAAK